MNVYRWGNGKYDLLLLDPGPRMLFSLFLIYFVLLYCFNVLFLTPL